jgi:hypothetical protein
MPGSAMNVCFAGTKVNFRPVTVFLCRRPNISQNVVDALLKNPLTIGVRGKSQNTGAGFGRLLLFDEYPLLRLAVSFCQYGLE